MAIDLRKVEIEKAILIGIATTSRDKVAVEESLDDEEALVLVSSDLSHYLPYEAARRKDEATARAITDLYPSALDDGSACGLAGIQALLLAARRRGLAVTCLDLRNSGDTTGDHERVVGYGAFSLG